jgi:exopolyphosphatase/guanosine-5'-triphosphate,3'-diphosphate pyrophosphatase
MKLSSRIASIDIGTNTVLMLIADVNTQGKITTVHEEQRIIRLGKNVDAEKNIGVEGLNKCADVLREYKTIADKFACDQLTACGTSALRDARNREWFCDEIKRQTGVTIEILSGDEEAMWTFQGGRLVLSEPDIQNEILVIDIGGGSTEFIQGNTSTIHHKISLDIGAVRLTEKFIHSDPITSAEEKALTQFAADLMKEKLSNFKSGEKVQAIGVAGTITTLAAMEQQMGKYEPAKINGYTITKNSLQKLLGKLRPTTLVQRKSLKGLQPERADVIFAGAIILSEAMRYFNLNELTVSNHGLRYGLVLRLIKH